MGIVNAATDKVVTARAQRSQFRKTASLPHLCNCQGTAIALRQKISTLYTRVLIDSSEANFGNKFDTNEGYTYYCRKGKESPMTGRSSRR